MKQEENGNICKPLDNSLEATIEEIRTAYENVNAKSEDRKGRETRKDMRLHYK